MDKVAGEPPPRGFQMNNLLGPCLAIGATIVLLLLRELILSVGKKDRKTYGVRDDRPVVPDLECEHSLRAQPIVEFEEPIPGATPIGVFAIIPVNKQANAVTRQVAVKTAP